MRLNNVLSSNSISSITTLADQKIPFNTIYQNYFLEFKQNEINVKLREYFGCLKSSAIFWSVHTRTVTLRGVVIHNAGLMKAA